MSRTQSHNSNLPIRQKPSDIKFPSSSETVTVRVIDSTTRLTLDGSLFWQGDIPHFNTVNSPVYCFLVSHGDRHVVFDLAVRKDIENYAPRMVSLIDATTKVTVEKDIAQILDEDSGNLGVTKDDIEAVILSHMHFDHVGDPTTFPSHTDLVVGPGYLDATASAYPTNKDALTLESDTSGRKVREVSFKDDEGACKFGSFDALDYFGDGSFYLLDAPGHSVGHICAVARISTQPERFIFMGADACHHVGVIRPSQWLPVPSELHLPELGPNSCPGEVIEAIHPQHDNKQAMLKPGPKMFPDYDGALRTVKAMQELDASGRVLVVIAHDHTLMDHIPLYPKAINSSNTFNIALKTRWLFCQDFEESIHEEEARRVAITA